MEKDQIDKEYKMVLIGGSAGSLEVLMQLLPKLPKLYKIILVIILHRKSGEDQTLEDLISIKTTVPVCAVEDKTELQVGNIYIAPSDYHLLFESTGFLALDTSEKINHSRPSIDVSFESAADIFKSGLTTILLSGANNDGTAGMIACNNEGGITIAQNPQSAEMPFMPQSAIDHANPDFIMDVDQILKYIIEADQ